MLVKSFNFTESCGSHLKKKRGGLGQPKCPSTNKWINEMWSLHTMEYGAAAAAAKSSMIQPEKEMKY